MSTQSFPGGAEGDEGRGESFTLQTWNCFGAAQGPISFLSWRGVPDSHRLTHPEVRAHAREVTDGMILASAEALASLDVAAGIAEWAEETQATRPEIDETSALLAEGARRRRSLGGVLGHRDLNDVVEGARKRGVEVGDARRRLLQVGHDDRGRSVGAAKRGLAGEEPEQRATQ